MEDANSAVSDVKLVPIVELLDGEHRFFVPNYQRGYRWMPQQVVELLEDLLTFAITEKDKQAFYCLQPVVVRWDEDGRGGDRWEVIDGQQRLTTIKILLHWLQLKTGEDDWSTLNVKSYSIEYATRKETTKFIDSLNPNTVLPAEDDPIDFFFIKKAYSTIDNWFVGKGDFTGRGAPALCERLSEPPRKAREFILDLLTSKPGQNPTARILWYKADPRESGIALFNRLNTGKLELTDSELVKGLFMLKSGNGADSDNEQFRTALKWERMENALHDDAFWCFLTPRREKDNLHTNRIDLLLELVFHERYVRRSLEQETGSGVDDVSEEVRWKKYKDCASKAEAALKKKRAVFNYYNDRFNTTQESRGKAVEESWKEIETTFLVLADWFSDPEIYNLVGYLCQTGTSKMPDLFHEFQTFSEDGKTRADFIKYMKGRIHDSLSGIQVVSLSDENNYTINLSYGERYVVFNLLLLLNVEQLNLRAASEAMKPGEREACKFPFAILADNWDIEHVDSRTANSLEKPEDCLAWIMTSLKDLSIVLPKDKLDDLWKHVWEILDLDPNQGNRFDMTNRGWDNFETSLKANLGKKEKVEQLIRQIQGVADENDDEVHGEDDNLGKDNIANLVLLDAGTNRSYKNALFITKRRKIIKRREEGQFVPETTAYVFFKLFEGNASTRWEWTFDDRQRYANYIVERLADYLTIPARG